MFRSDFLPCEPEYPDIQSRASMLLLYSILNTEKGVKNPFQCTNMNKKIDKKITFIHNVYANCFKYMVLEELFTNCIRLWDNPQTKHTQLLYFIVASQLWEI